MMMSSDHKKYNTSVHSPFRGWASKCLQATSAICSNCEPEDPYCSGTEVTDQLRYKAVSYQGMVLAELLPCLLRLSLWVLGATSTDWQQDDMLSIGFSEEVGKQELTFPSEDVESDSSSPAVKLSLAICSNCEPEDPYCSGTEVTDQLRYKAVSYQGMVLAELLPCLLRLSLWVLGATSTDWQQDDMLSIGFSEEVGKQELTFPSEDVESDSSSPAVKLSLSVELLPLIKRATAVLQVPWPTEGETRPSIFDDEPTTSPVPPPNTPRLSF
ncbi:UNVERIFIED_CONTAM: hypothetical protein FKN15_025279 [Acipenser sinensis]